MNSRSRPWWLALACGMSICLGGCDSKKSGTGVIPNGADKATAGEGRVEKTIPARFGMDTFDIGMDLNAAVVRGGIYKTPYKFTGKIDKVMIELKK
jgi:hypothetical protein